MDHLSQVADALRPHIEVPYVVRNEDVYDNLGLRRLKSEFLRRERTRDEALSFLQSWCFFGLITEVLRVPGVRVSAHDFICTGQNGQPRITTRRLPSCLLLWAFIEMKQSKEIIDHHRKEVQSILSLVSGFLLSRFYKAKEDWPGNYMEEGGSDDRTRYTHCSVLLSIAVLGESLSQFFEMNYKRYGAEPVSWPDCWFLKDLLLRAGWCEYEITLLRQRYFVGNTGLYYMSFTDQRLIEKDHTSCSGKICCADNINTESDQTKHVINSCHCQDIIDDSDIQRMTQIVSQGQVPLYTVTENEGGNCVVNIRAFKTGLSWGKQAPYVAISHVWSNGLGNTGRNSLPKCQLLQLQKFCNALYESESESIYRPIPFWIDTLCVPIEEGPRQEAIAMLASTFKEADKVLALDKSLMQTSVQVEVQEALMKILCSSWARRLWTFQEGAFSKSLYFRFLDGNFHEADMLCRRRLKIEQTVNREHESIIELCGRGNILSPIATVSELTNENWLMLELGLDYVSATAHRWFDLLLGDQITRRIVTDSNKLAYPLFGLGYAFATTYRWFDLLFGEQITRRAVKMLASQLLGLGYVFATAYKWFDLILGEQITRRAVKMIASLLLGLGYVFATAYRWFDLLLGGQITKRTVSDSKRLTYLLQIFGWRSATKPEDEAVCLAALLGQDTRALKKRDDRMKEVFLNAQNIPADIIFFCGPRLTEDGYRWIPKTWLHQTPTSCSTSQIATPCSSGLMVTYSGLLLNFEGTAFDDLSQAENRILVETGSNTWCVLFGDRLGGAMGSGSDTTPGQGTVILTLTRFASLQTAIILPPQGDHYGGPSALVTIEKQMRGVLFVKFEGIVLAAGPFGKEDTTDEGEGGRATLLITVRATTLPPSQKWCVG